MVAILFRPQYVKPPSHVPYLSWWLGEGMDDGAGITAVNHEGVGSPPQHVVDQGLQVRQWGVDTHHTQVSARMGSWFILKSIVVH